MRKTAFMIAAAFLTVACQQGEQKANTAAAEQTTLPADGSQTTTMVFSDDKFDFGKVSEGEVVAHSYTFTNTGKYPLIIKSATASCGCTVPSWPKEPVAPGATGAIDVKFSTEGRPGLQEKNVTITANTEPGITQLRLFGEVKGK